MNQSDLIQNRSKLIEQLPVGSFAVLFSGEAPHKSADALYPYTANRNFYYLTGCDRENFILVLVKGKVFSGCYLFIEEASDYATKWIGRRLTKEEVVEKSGLPIENIRFVEEFSKFVTGAVLSDSRPALIEKPSAIYLDLYRYKPYAKPDALVRAESILESYPELDIRAINPLIESLRTFKSASEVDQIRQALAYSKIGLESVWTIGKPGVNERQIEAFYEYSIKMAGSKGPSFDSIVASGAHATTLHYTDNNDTIKEGDMVLLDMGALSGLYASDISRTFPANGHFTARQRQIYDIVLGANKATIDFIKPGIMWAEVNAFARNYLAEACVKIGLISSKEEITKYYYHNVSHYLGLDVHDVGSYKIPLAPGMVMTVEPGLYIEEEGIGIRIEDNVLVTEQGCENLSVAILKEADDIEAFIKRSR